MAVQVQVNGAWMSFETVAQAKAFMNTVRHPAAQPAAPATKSASTGGWGAEDDGVCNRCAGTGVFKNFGECFRCGGKGRAPGVPLTAAGKAYLARVHGRVGQPITAIARETEMVYTSVPRKRRAAKKAQARVSPNVRPMTTAEWDRQYGPMQAMD